MCLQKAFCHLALTGHVQLHEADSGVAASCPPETTACTVYTVLGDDPAPNDHTSPPPPLSPLRRTLQNPKSKLLGGPESRTHPNRWLSKAAAGCPVEPTSWGSAASLQGARPPQSPVTVDK